MHTDTETPTSRRNTLLRWLYMHNDSTRANSAIAAFRLSHIEPDQDSAELPSAAVEVSGFGGTNVYMTGAVGEDEYDISDSIWWKSRHLHPKCQSQTMA